MVDDHDFELYLDDFEPPELDLKPNPNLEEQSEEIINQLDKLAKVRQCSREIAWQKVLKVCDMLNLDILNSLDFLCDSSDIRGTRQMKVEPWT